MPRSGIRLGGTRLEGSGTAHTECVPIRNWTNAGVSHQGQNIWEVGSVTTKFLAAAIIATGVFAIVVMNLPNNFRRALHMASASAAPLMSTSITGLQSLASDPVDMPHFNTLPATGVFAEGGSGYTSAQCAAALDPNASSDMYNGHPINQETVLQNQQSHSPGSPATGITAPVNQTKPNVSQLAYYASDGYRSSEMDPPYTWIKLVDGQYTGTTEMIIRWAACKWGMDEDM